MKAEYNGFSHLRNDLYCHVFLRPAIEFFIRNHELKTDFQDDCLFSEPTIIASRHMDRLDVPKTAKALYEHGRSLNGKPYLTNWIMAYRLTVTENFLGIPVTVPTYMFLRSGGAAEIIRPSDFRKECEKLRKFYSKHIDDPQVKNDYEFETRLLSDSVKEFNQRTIGYTHQLLAKRESVVIYPEGKLMFDRQDEMKHGLFSKILSSEKGFPVYITPLGIKSAGRSGSGKEITELNFGKSIKARVGMGKNEILDLFEYTKNQIKNLSGLT